MFYKPKKFVPKIKSPHAPFSKGGAGGYLPLFPSCYTIVTKIALINHCYDIRRPTTPNVIPVQTGIQGNRISQYRVKIYRGNNGASYFHLLWRRLLMTLFVMLASVVVLAGCFTKPTPQTLPGSSPETANSTTTVKPPINSAWDKTVEIAKKEGSLTIYSFNFGGETGVRLTQAFKDKYGINLEVVTGRGSEFVERLKTERRLGQKTADVSEGSITNLLQMKAEGLIAPVKDLPVLADRDVWILDPLATDSEAHILNYTPYMVTPWVNTNLVKPGQEPVSFKDLLKPEWKGKIITDDPLTSSSVYLYYVPLANARVIDWNYVKSLAKQDMQLRTGPIQMTQSLARGDFPIVLLNADSIVSPFIKEGAPIRAIALIEGDVIGANGISVIKEAPHPNAARLFIDWLFGIEGQTLYNSLKASASVRKDVPDFRPPAARATSRKLIVTTARDYADTARLMQDRFMAGMWTN